MLCTPLQCSLLTFRHYIGLAGPKEEMLGVGKSNLILEKSREGRRSDKVSKELEKTVPSVNT